MIWFGPTIRWAQDLISECIAVDSLLVLFSICESRENYLKYVYFWFICSIGFSIEDMVIYIHCWAVDSIDDERKWTGEWSTDRQTLAVVYGLEFRCCLMRRRSALLGSCVPASLVLIIIIIIGNRPTLFRTWIRLPFAAASVASLSRLTNWLALSSSTR